MKRETISIKKNHSLPKTISTEESKIRISEVIKIGKRGVPLCKVVGCTKYAQGASNKRGLCARHNTMTKGKDLRKDEK